MTDFDAKEWKAEEWAQFCERLEAALREKFGKGEFQPVDDNSIFVFETEGRVLHVYIDGTTDEPPKEDEKGRYYLACVHDGKQDANEPIERLKIRL